MSDRIEDVWGKYIQVESADPLDPYFVVYHFLKAEDGEVGKD